MIFKRTMWNGGPVLRLATDRQTKIFADGPRSFGREEALRYRKTVVAWVGRFGTSDDTYPVYSIGSGFGIDHALEVATDALMERVGDWMYEVEDADESEIHYVNGVPVHVPDDTFMMVVL